MIGFNKTRGMCAAKEFLVSQEELCSVGSVFFSEKMQIALDAEYGRVLISEWQPVLRNFAMIPRKRTLHSPQYGSGILLRNVSMYATRCRIPNTMIFATTLFKIRGR